jgi:hypothetical protein
MQVIKIDNSIFYDQWSKLFSWGHAEAKAGNMKKARLLVDISDRLRERNRKYNKANSGKRKGLFYI